LACEESGVQMNVGMGHYIGNHTRRSQASGTLGCSTALVVDDEDGAKEAQTQ
jgi:hypothetical protein